MWMTKFVVYDKSRAFAELSRKRAMKNISGEERQKIADSAWNHGIEVGKKFFDRNCGSVYEIVNNFKLEVKHVEDSCFACEKKYLAEYFPDINRINIYITVLQYLAEKSDMEYFEIEEYAIAHELFHYLEQTTIGSTAKLFTIPRFTIANCTWGRRNIPFLSEIGAYAFSFYFWKMRHCDKR